MDRVLGEQHHFFSMKDINVKQYVLIVSFYCENDMGVQAKTIGRLKRRSYNLKIPNQLWHIDANQKLSRWYIIIFFADTILYFYLSGVQTYCFVRRVLVRKTGSVHEKCSSCGFHDLNCR